jgi:glycosyltransferase involved in cell wall biosynthesis
VAPWRRYDLFRPRDIRLFGRDGPVFLYVGRVFKEKNIEAFLDLELPGKKVVVGPGPHLATLRCRYPGIIFAGPKSGLELALHYASAECVCLPEPDRYVWARPARGHGVRATGRGLSGDRSD